MFSALLDQAFSEGTLHFSQVHPGGPRPRPASSSRVLIGQGVPWNLNSVISQLQALSLQWLNSPDFSTGQISLLEYRDNSSSLLPAPPPSCAIVYLMWFFFFYETLKENSRLAQPLRKVSDSCICLFYIKLSNVLCMFFLYVMGGGTGNLHINSPSSTICYFFNYYFLSSL